MQRYIAIMDNGLGYSVNVSNDNDAIKQAQQLASDKNANLTKVTTGMTPATFRVVYNA